MIGDGASDVMSHAALVSCIHVPTFEAHEASHSARKTGKERGLQAEGAWTVVALLMIGDVYLYQLVGN